MRVAVRMCPSMGVAVCAKIELGNSTISNTDLRVIYVVNEMQGLDDSSRFPYHCVNECVTWEKYKDVATSTNQWLYQATNAS